MPLTLAALVPHSPLLVERIGGGRTASLGPTVAALETIAGELAQAKVDTVVAIGDHGGLRPDRLTLVMSPQLKLQLRKFGDVTTERTWSTDIALGNALREYGETNLPLCTVAQDEIGYAVGIPLSFVTKYCPATRVVCIGPALLSAQDHRSLGLAIRSLAEQTPSRVAVVAAGDIPEGSPEFAEAAAAAIGGQPRAAQDDRWADSPQAMAWRTIAVLLGATDGLAMDAEVLADQRVFETGLLTAVFRQ